MTHLSKPQTWCLTTDYLTLWPQEKVQQLWNLAVSKRRACQNTLSRLDTQLEPDSLQKSPLEERAIPQKAHI